MKFISFENWLNERFIDTLDKIYDYFMKVDISKLNKYKAIDKAFLDGYAGKNMSMNVNVNSPFHKAWLAGKERKSKSENEARQGIYK